MSRMGLEPVEAVRLASLAGDFVACTGRSHRPADAFRERCVL